MKALILFISAFLFQSAFAESQIACWNTYSKKGSRPVLTADIYKDNYLKNIAIDYGDTKEGDFSGYFWKSDDGKEKSSLTQPTPNDVKAQEITTGHSPYQGNNEFDLAVGKSTWYKDYDYTFRLIMPVDLSNENLKTFRFKSRPNERTNAVLVMPPPQTQDNDTYGDGYLRMFCVSK